jgi:bifunctional DNA-binding transcriptional regulator/antitoxin component of YhaV-PrlF toxin-antitoxin module
LGWEYNALVLILKAGISKLSQTYISQHAKEKIQNCVEKGFEFLDESAKISVFWHLENDFGITKDSIIEKPDEFVNALRGIFGDGSIILEKKISKEICNTFAISMQHALKFSEVIEVAKKQARSWEEERKNWKHF